MKQTNNAIKFLMAQYRAIFKNANIAMVAAMAAAALAAGQAQAQPIEKFDNAALAAEGTPDKVTVAGDSAAAGEYKKLELTGGANSAKALEIKITAGDAHTIKGVAAGSSPDTTPAKPDVNLGNTSFVIEAGTDATLTIGESGAVGGTPAAAATNVTVADITVNKGTLALVAKADDKQLATSVTAANLTVGLGGTATAGDEAKITVAKHTSINATEALTVNSGSKITVAGGGTLSGQTVTINDGTVELGDGGDADNLGTLSSTGKLDIKGGEVKSVATGSARISASEISLAKALVSSGSLVVDGALTAKNGATITNDSTLVINDNFDAESGSTVTNNDGAAKVITFNGQTTFKAGSKISNSGAMVIAGKADFKIADTALAQDLKVGGTGAALKVVSGGTANTVSYTHLTLPTT